MCAAFSDSPDLCVVVMVLTVRVQVESPKWQPDAWWRVAITWPRIAQGPSIMFLQKWMPLEPAIKNHVRVYKDLPKDYPIEIANKEELPDLEPRPRKRART